MKIIVTGVTGFLGQEVLRQGAVHPKITEIVALSRRDLAEEFQKDKYKKITVVKMEEFGTYPEDVLEKLKGAEGCIWTIGTIPANIKKHNISPEKLRKINVEWPLDAANVFTSKLPLLDGKKFRFAYTSGFMVPDPGQEGGSMWVMGDYRMLRFETDKGLLDLAKEGKLEASIFKPAFITNGQTLSGLLTLGYMTVTVQAAAAGMLDAVVNGARKDIYQNGDMRAFGAEALAKLKEKN